MKGRIKKNKDLRPVIINAAIRRRAGGPPPHPCPEGLVGQFYSCGCYLPTYPGDCGCFPWDPQYYCGACYLYT